MIQHSFRFKMKSIRSKSVKFYHNKHKHTFVLKTSYVAYVATYHAGFKYHPLKVCEGNRIGIGTCPAQCANQLPQITSAYFFLLLYVLHVKKKIYPYSVVFITMKFAFTNEFCFASVSASVSEYLCKSLYTSFDGSIFLAHRLVPV